MYNLTEEIENDNYLPGTTYWLNEYMHVGHITFDIVLMQLLKNTKIDRIILQRAACNGNLCFDLGTVRSFFGAYFGAILDAFQPGIPVYMRYTWHERAVTPMFASTLNQGYEYEVGKGPELKDWQKALKPIVLKGRMCFERVIRRGPTYYGNYYGSVAPEVIEEFRKKAYSSPNIKVSPPLTTHFKKDPPYVILFSYRAPPASRAWANSAEFLQTLRNNFLPPTYEVRAFNNANGTHNTAEHQIATVGSANVIVTNHGAFEGNIINMRNGTLLIELSGAYNNPEFRFFQHFAHMFGVYYSRMETSNLVDHAEGNINVTESEMGEVVDMVKQFFDLKPFLFNAKD